MIRLVLFLVLLAAFAFGVGWLADRPGEIAMVWQGWRVETTVPVALAAVAVIAGLMLVAWRLMSGLVRAPALMTTFSRRRRREKGWAALSRGLLAIGAGDAAAARRARDEAARLLPGAPLTRLLAAQAAQFEGDRDGAIAAFQAMAEDPETRLLGLRGLHMEARRAGDLTAARLAAEEAAAAAPALAWAAEAVIEARCAEGDFPGARAALERQMAQKGIDKAQYRRRRAVLLAAEALALELTDPAVARERAMEAVRLAPTLVPAAAVAGRLLGAAGDLRKAAKIVETAYAATPHPELADVEAFLRPGDAVLDRLKRVRLLVAKAPRHPESAIALARAAVDAHEFADARRVLEPLLAAPSQRVCLLMAELEAAEHSDIGKAREWTARAVRATRDPAWIADGIVSDHWAPVSPVSGRLDAFVWEVPPGVSATPILEHEAERVRLAIAAARAREEALAAVPAPMPAAEPAAPAVSPPAADPAPRSVAAAGQGAAQPAPSRIPGGMEVLPPAPPISAPAPPPPANDRTRPSRAEPIVAMPPLPDDPGPEGEAPEDPETGPRRPRILGV